MLAETQLGTAQFVPEITLHLAHAALPLWHATEAKLEKNGVPPPYWAFAWPGGQALARLVLDQPDLVRGMDVLDFAAGSGISAIAASKAGARRVRAAEIDAFARVALALNATVNQVSIEAIAQDLLQTDAFDPAQVILAGDVCYEQPMATQAIAWLRRRVADGARVLLADPGRAYFPKTGVREIARYDIPTSLDLESNTIRSTGIFELADS
ncbi:class I SAM-dependent methyltransferase [Roseiterribacter gracilis]|uniref:Nicotinamide N-methylase n=1 Tax=Roseiterribacter gracilis TaxID=2812848 RepID=A0A8S8XGL2_9PROT|nr:nicotinamide N-methylase [Rhodospirillales bacterium TMPK1]